MPTGEAGPFLDPWRDVGWITCSDGKVRPVPKAATEPALRVLDDGSTAGVDRFGTTAPHPAALAVAAPLALGSPGRVGQLRGLGNALVAPQAEAFIRAYLDTLAERA